MILEPGRAYRRARKWSPDQFSSVSSETLERFDKLFVERSDIKLLVRSLKELIQGYRYLKESHALKVRKNIPIPAYFTPPSEMIRVRLTNLSLLFCEELGSIEMTTLFRMMSEQRILAYKHDLSEQPEKLGLALAFVRIACTANATIKNCEWGSKWFADLVRKYQEHPDAVIASIRLHGVLDERLIEAEIAGVHPSLHEGSL